MRNTGGGEVLGYTIAEPEGAALNDAEYKNSKAFDIYIQGKRQPLIPTSKRQKTEQQPLGT
jgi:hypothetical protein